jgi:hypothetical protein
MKKPQKNTANIYGKTQRKYKKLVLKNIRKQVEQGTNFSTKELKKQYNEEQLFFIGLKHTTATNKSFCKAFNIPIEAGCRYKRNYEKLGLLKQSINEIVCPFTKHLAHLISTNPNEFLSLTETNQLKMF